MPTARCGSSGFTPLFARKVRKKEMKSEDGVATLDVAKNRSWRLFQMAFVLLNLPSLTDLHHPDRSHETDAVADLLWFATGGGKTEAYLGLTAYTLALRRLQGEIEGRRGDHGIAVLMRYTLRLLTLQQFQRAAALMCACETIRRADAGQVGRDAFPPWVCGSATRPRRIPWPPQPMPCASAMWAASHRRPAPTPDYLLPMVRQRDQGTAPRGL